MKLTPEEQQALSEAPEQPRLTEAEIEDLHQEVIADRLHKSRLQSLEMAAEMMREVRESGAR